MPNRQLGWDAGPTMSGGQVAINKEKSKSQTAKNNSQKAWTKKTSLNEEHKLLGRERLGWPPVPTTDRHQQQEEGEGR